MMAKLHIRDDMSAVQPPLSQAVGYIVVVLIGIIIALGMISKYSSTHQSRVNKGIVMMLVTKILKKTTGEDNKKTEMYNPDLSFSDAY